MKEQTKRPHIYELDPLRACTAFSVIAVHVLAFTVLLNHTELSTLIHYAFIEAFHFTREVFLFVTAFALVYVYGGKAFPFKQFWKKRGIGTLLPYVAWSIIYVLVNTQVRTPEVLFQTSLVDILTGNASYQLYYILLTLQFYLIFPLFLLFLRRCARHPWIVLAISFVLQLLLFYFDFHALQGNSSHLSPFWQFFLEYQDRFVLMYQFYFVLGGLTALYFQQIKAFLLSHGKLVTGVFVASLAALWIHFTLQVRVFGEFAGYAVSVLQPVMVIYSLAIILFALWLACRWAMKTGREKRPRGARFWRTLSDASFGVYLVHALILSALLRWVVPAMPEIWSVAARVVLIWLITAGGSAIISILLLNIPIASRLVGRAGPQKKDRVSRPAPVPLLDQAIKVTLEEKSHNREQQAQRVP
ncbi:MAG TPA: acyltransferase [Ktedonobacteraceae bacterium]|nr:acyltransferase [Ktedonobacteraceae bacterium]